MPHRTNVVDQYLTFTRVTLPAAATHDWPIRDDHCFQRIVLDMICGGVWYDHIARPAYRHMTLDQAERAVALCQAILDGTADLECLNAQSIAWRQNRKDDQLSFDL